MGRIQHRLFGTSERHTQVLILWLVFVSIGFTAKVAAQNSSSNVTVFVPATDVYINCGGVDVTVPDLGTFMADTYTSSGESQNSALNDADPYPGLFQTARIFETTGTYDIPVASPGRVWLRLWFYPTNFQESATSKINSSFARFSVSANNVTLLADLQASDIQSDANSYLFEEFIVNVSTGNLSITFQPARQGFAFAYVNGLAVVSVPDNLLINNFGGGTSMVEGDVDSTIALQTVYRLNVGGSVVPATNDSSLSRRWDVDSPYLYGIEAGAPLRLPSNDSIIYPANVPRWIAPSSVYATARTLTGSISDPNDPSINAFLNLTWMFDVDPGFSYFVRLHFAELNSSVQSNVRVFDVFLNNETVLAAYDCVAAGRGVDTLSFRDFVVDMNGKTDNALWVAMTPSRQDEDFANVILNGMEIFKLIDSSSSDIRGKGAALHRAWYICLCLLSLLFFNLQN